MKNNQTFYIEYHEEMTRRSRSKVNYLVEKQGKLVLPSEFIVLGQSQRAVDLKGSIIGAINFTVGEGRTVYLDDGARILPLLKRSGQSNGTGILAGVLTIEANGKLQFENTALLNTSDFILRAGASLKAKVSLYTCPPSLSYLLTLLLSYFSPFNPIWTGLFAKPKKTGCPLLTWLFQVS